MNCLHLLIPEVQLYAIKAENTSFEVTCEKRGSSKGLKGKRIRSVL